MIVSELLDNDEFFYLSIGFMGGYFFHKYNSKILYTGYKYYVLTSEKIRKLKQKFRKDPTLKSELVKEVSFELPTYFTTYKDILDTHQTHIEVDESSTGVIQVYKYGNKQIYTCRPSIIPILFESKYHFNLDVILSAYFCVGDKVVTEITTPLDTILSCDGHFLFVDELKQHWWDLWGTGEEIDIDELSIEMITRSGLIPVNFKNDIIKIEPQEDGSITEEIIHVN